MMCSRRRTDLPMELGCSCCCHVMLAPVSQLRRLFGCQVSPASQLVQHSVHRAMPMPQLLWARARCLPSWSAWVALAMLLLRPFPPARRTTAAAVGIAGHLTGKVHPAVLPLLQHLTLGASASAVIQASPFSMVGPWEEQAGP